MTTNRSLYLPIMNLVNALHLGHYEYCAALDNAPPTVRLFSDLDVEKVADHFNVGVTIHNGMAHATVRIDGTTVIFAAPSVTA